MRNQIKAQVKKYYKSENPTEDQINKLVNIYQHEMENEGTTDVKDFFLDLEDSSACAFIELKDLPKYKGY